jgi:hypothetical protein
MEILRDEGRDGPRPILSRAAERREDGRRLDSVRMSPRSRDRLAAVLVALAGPLLLAVHTGVFCRTVDFAELDAWRRLWSDLAQASGDWVEREYGPAPVQATGDAADTLARELILERIDKQGMSAARPWEVVRSRPFAAYRFTPESKRFDDHGRASLLALAFRLRGGIAPFLVLWLGLLVAAPIAAWTALELRAAGRTGTALVFAVLLGASPFVVETLALARYPVGFYLCAVLLIVPLAVHARLNPAPTLRGAAVRVVAASAGLALCTFCRSSAAVLLPGFVLAAWLALRRVVPSGRRALGLTLAAGTLLALPAALVPGAQQSDMWQPVWEGLGDFDRTHAFTWADSAAAATVRAAGVSSLWTPASEAVLRQQVVQAVRADPAWYLGVLARRAATTVTLWRLWPWTPMGGTFIRESRSPNEGVLDKYWTYTTTIDFLGMGERQVEMPVPLLVAPTLALIALGIRGPRARAARDALIVLACPAVATLVLPVLVTTAGGQEGQAFGLVYLLGAALLVDVVRSAPAA